MRHLAPYLTLCATLLLAAGCAPSPASPTAPAPVSAVVEANQQRGFDLGEANSLRPVYLVVAGRFDSRSEDWPRRGIALTFNGMTLTDDRLVAPQSDWGNIVSPFLADPQRLFDPEGRTWHFRPDNDFLANNGTVRAKSDTPGYCLVFDVTTLARRNGNHLDIANRLGRNFIVRHVALQTEYAATLADLNRFAEDPATTLVPGWAYLYYRNPLLARNAEAAFAGDPVRRAELDVSLALGDLHRDDREGYVNRLRAALERADDFPNRNFVRYALVAEGIDAPPALPERQWPAGLTNTILQYGNAALWDRRVRTVQAMREGLPMPGDALPTARIPKVPGAGEIVIDGEGGDAAWERGARLTVHAPIGSGQPQTTGPAIATLLYDDNALYARFEGPMPPNPLGPVGEGDGTAVWNTNCVEFFFAPWLAPYRYFELNADVFGIGWTTSTSMTYPRTRLVDEHGQQRNIPVNWERAARVDEGRFVVEYRIPFDELRIDTPKAGDLWTANIVFLQWGHDDLGKRVNRIAFWSGLPVMDYHFFPGYGFFEFE